MLRCIHSSYLGINLLSQSCITHAIKIKNQVNILNILPKEYLSMFKRIVQSDGRDINGHHETQGRFTTS